MSNRDTLMWGIIAAIAMTILGCGFFYGLRYCALNYTDLGNPIFLFVANLSDKMVVMSSLLFTFLPVKIFESQGRYEAQRGASIIAGTLLLGALLWNFVL